MKSPLLVLTPTYNSKHLKECIDSCKLHISVPYIHIIVDDGSDKKEFLREAYDRKEDGEFIKVFKLRENMGCGHVRNALMQHARRYDPEYVVWLDSDDQFTDRFMDMLWAAELYSSDIVCGRLTNHRRKNQTSDPTNKLFKNRKLALEDNSFLSMTLLGKLFRWSAIKDLTFPEIRRIEDYVFMENLSRKKDLIVTDFPYPVYDKLQLTTGAGATGVPPDYKKLLEYYCKYEIENPRYLSEAR